MNSNISVAFKFIIAGIVLTLLAFLLKNWLRWKKARAVLPTLQPEIRLANAELASLLDKRKYFSDPEEKGFLQRFSNPRKLIVRRFDKLGLNDSYVEEIRQFVSRFDGLSKIRKEYNDAFVKQEARDYAGLFNNLEEYPLSEEQIETQILWARNRCSYRCDISNDCFVYEKRLSKLKKLGFSLEKILIIDDTPEK